MTYNAFTQLLGDVPSTTVLQKLWVATRPIFGGLRKAQCGCMEGSSKLQNVVDFWRREMSSNIVKDRSVIGPSQCMGMHENRITTTPGPPFIASELILIFPLCPPLKRSNLNCTYIKKLPNFRRLI